MNTGESKVTHKHEHAHFPRTVIEEIFKADAVAAVDKDRDIAFKLAEVASNRQTFTGKVRPTAYGDKKNHSGQGLEHAQALMDNQIIADSQAQAAMVVEAAAHEGIIMEEPQNPLVTEN